MIYLLTYDGYMKKKRYRRFIINKTVYAMRSKRLYIGIPQVLWNHMPTLEQEKSCSSHLEVGRIWFKEHGSNLSQWNLSKDKLEPENRKRCFGCNGFSNRGKHHLHSRKKKKWKQWKKRMRNTALITARCENALDRAKDREEAYGTLYPGTRSIRQTE